jgi:hypothetical protein
VCAAGFDQNEHGDHGGWLDGGIEFGPKFEQKVFYTKGF